MKKLLPIVIISFFLAACGTEELSREEALEIIKQQKPYPHIVDYDIFQGDPVFAKLALQAGLDKKGLVTIQRVQKLRDVGKPLIIFTEKAKPFLLPTSKKDQAFLVQKVKLADEEIEDALSIKVTEDNTQAIVEYTTAYKNVNEFAGMTTFNFNKTNNRKAFLVKYDKKWKFKKEAVE